MTIEEELLAVRAEKKVLREQLAQRDELIQQQALLAQQNAVIQQHAEQMNRLSEQMKALRDRPAKDSHNSHLPPSSDRWGRKPKSLPPKSERPIERSGTLPTCGTKKMRPRNSGCDPIRIRSGSSAAEVFLSGGMRNNGEAPIWKQTGIVARLGRPRFRARRSAERTADPRIELHHRQGARLLAR